MNNNRSLRSIFERYQTDLLRFVASRFGNRNDTEDIVQDAFYNILKADNLDNIENPKAYLYRAARNLALKRLRSEEYHVKYVEQVDLDQVAVSPEASVSARKHMEHIENVLAELPQKYRRTFEMSRVREMSYREISEELGIGHTTVEKHIIKALKHLREHLGEDWREV